MDNIVNLDDFRKCDHLGSLDIYRHPGGTIILGMNYMDEDEIDRVDTISERFEMVSKWLADGLPSLAEQAENFREAPCHPTSDRD